MPQYWWWITAGLIMLSYALGKTMGYNELKDDILEWVNSGGLEKDLEDKMK